MGMVAALSSSVGLRFECKSNFGDLVVDCAHRKIFRRRPEQRTKMQGMTLTSIGEKLFVNSKPRLPACVSALVLLGERHSTHASAL